MSVLSQQMETMEEVARHNKKMEVLSETEGQAVQKELGHKQKSQNCRNKNQIRLIGFLW